MQKELDAAKAVREQRQIELKQCVFPGTFRKKFIVDWHLHGLIVVPARFHRQRSVLLEKETQLQSLRQRLDANHAKKCQRREMRRKRSVELQSELSQVRQKASPLSAIGQLRDFDLIESHLFILLRVCRSRTSYQNETRLKSQKSSPSTTPTRRKLQSCRHNCPTFPAKYRWVKPILQSPTQDKKN